MSVKIKADAPMWLHLLATSAAAAVWFAIAWLNAAGGLAHPMDPEFPKTLTLLLAGSLLQRFGVASDIAQSMERRRAEPHEGSEGRPAGPGARDLSLETWTPPARGGPELGGLQ